jgi:hypothetical protein
VAEIQCRLIVEFLAEALVAFLQVFGEFLLQLILEALVELGARGFASVSQGRPPPTPLHPVLAGLGYALLGAAVGALSLHFFPSSLAHARWLKILTLILVPLLAGLAMNALGAWRLRRDQNIIRLDRFGYAYLFAFSLALVRFTWAR